VNIGSGRSGEGPRGIRQKRPKNQPAWVFPSKTPPVRAFPFWRTISTIFRKAGYYRELWILGGGHTRAFRKNSLKNAAEVMCPAFACGFRFRNRTAEDVFVPSFFTLLNLPRAASETHQSG